ncbi:MAG: type II toxin-antitoxin system VapB family antitoxin [Acidiferrobacteraceae bacterium]
MRTTLDIDDDLMREAKRRAAERGETLTRVMEQALRESFRKEQAVRETAFRFKWVTVRGSLRPGVDLTDRDALYEHMEGRR